MLFASLAFAAHISFGPTLIEFHTLVRSFMTLFNYLIGLYEQAPETVKDLTRKTGYDSLDYAGQHATVFVAEGGFFCFFFQLVLLLSVDTDLGCNANICVLSCLARNRKR